MTPRAGLTIVCRHRGGSVIPPQALPARATPLIGRASALEAAKQRLRSTDVRLLTFTGPGGTGKTRLALEVADALRDDFVDGVWLIDLSPIRDARLVSSAIARAVGVDTSGDVLEVLAQELRDKQCLLVVDNFEQVMPAAGEVSLLLAECPRLRVVVTSRAPLDLAWEHVFPVPPLALADAMHLFVQRATAARGDFELDNDGRTVVAEICTRVDGLPLAIELAAARTRLLPLNALLTRLQRRLDVLKSGRPDMPQRHHTMAGTIDWSYALLPPDERALFRQLGVFVGGCSLDAVEAMAPDMDVLEALGSLVNKSLLRVDDSGAGEARYRMLETLREFALDRLRECDEEHQARQAQALFLRDLVEQAEPELRGAHQSEWLDRLEREHDNLRGALAWSIQHDLETALRLSGALWRFWFTRGFMQEGQDTLEAILERTAEASGVPLLVRARALTAAGEMAWGRGDIDRAARHHRASLQLRRELGDLTGVAQALHNLGNLAIERGELVEAQALHEESLEIRRWLGNARDVSLSLKNLGRLAVARGHLESAQAMLEESLALAREVGGNLTVAGPLRELGDLELVRGNTDRAAAYYAECLRLACAIGAAGTIARGVETAAMVAHARGDVASAAHLIAAGEAIRDAIRSPMVPTELAPLEPALAAARAALGEAGFVRATAEGRGWSMQEAAEAAFAVLERTATASAEDRPAGLSARELEVVQLIAAGLTNRQIADRLVISERTAHAHVRNILDKLGLGSRVEVATWALQHGVMQPA